MTRAEILAWVVAELQSIAPGCEPASADPDADLREELDIDSMDFLNFIVAIHKTLGVNIPEGDYPKLATLNGIAAYLDKKLRG